MTRSGSCPRSPSSCGPSAAPTTDPPTRLPRRRARSSPCRGSWPTCGVGRPFLTGSQVGLSFPPGTSCAPLVTDEVSLSLRHGHPHGNPCRLVWPEESDREQHLRANRCYDLGCLDR